MSDTEESQNSQVSEHEEEEEEVKNKYIHSLIERIVEKYPELDKKCIYKLLIKKSRFYYNECESMKDDPLWEKIINEAEAYKVENEDIGCSDTASFECAFREHKPLIMEMIENVINDDDSMENDHDDDGDDMEDEDGKNEVEDNNSIMDHYNARIIANQLGNKNVKHRRN